MKLKSKEKIFTVSTELHQTPQLRNHYLERPATLKGPHEVLWPPQFYFVAFWRRQLRLGSLKKIFGEVDVALHWGRNVGLYFRFRAKPDDDNALLPLPLRHRKLTSGSRYPPPPRPRLPPVRCRPRFQNLQIWKPVMICHDIWHFRNRITSAN